MKTATPDRSMRHTPATPLATMTVRPTRESAPTATSVGKSAVLVGLCFLTATFSFAIGNAFIHSYFSSAIPHEGALVAGALLLGCCGLAVAANGTVMRRILATHTPTRSQAYLALRVTECCTLVAVGAYFLMGHHRWYGYVLAIYAVSGVAGLVLSSALLTSRIVPRNLAMLGIIGYPVFLVGSIVAMFNLIDVTHGAGMLTLVPGGLFELILPIWLFTKGFTFHQIQG